MQPDLLSRLLLQIPLNDTVFLRIVVLQPIQRYLCTSEFSMQMISRLVIQWNHTFIGLYGMKEVSADAKVSEREIRPSCRLYNDRHGQAIDSLDDTTIASWPIWPPPAKTLALSRIGDDMNVSTICSVSKAWMWRLCVVCGYFCRRQAV